jgi:crossover junction endodeoxyribonuclease RuvC
MRVLGIDPSLSSTGYGIIEYSRNHYSVLAHGVIKPETRLPFPQRIHAIKIGIEQLIRDHKPHEVAIENLFYAHNVKTAIILGQVRGAALVAVAGSTCRLFEYSALEIKKAVTGFGQADKHQVAHMVRILLNLSETRLESDVSDALATAICHLNARMFQQKITSVEE